MSRASEQVHPSPELRNGNGDVYQWASPGLTIREHFAAMAMQGLTQCSLTPEDIPAGMAWRDIIAKTAAQMADALIAELAKPVTPPQTPDYRERVAADVVRRVCESPDYTSPDNEPELVMCKVGELHQIVLIALEQVQP